LGEAPDPAEHLLAAVGSSVSVTFTAHAALLGVAVEKVHVSLAAEIDAHKFFHPDAAARAGLLDIHLKLIVSSSAPRAQVRRVLREALCVAPVLRSLKRLPRVEFVHRQVTESSAP
jgi:pyruvate dehydrogenase E2 component (dihydrolipoamide acetyltransferase)